MSRSPSANKSRSQSKGSDAKNKPRSRVATEASVPQPQPVNVMCGYMHRVCLQTRLEGYEFCIRHILFDRNAPFKQCSYVHPQSNKRCPNAARRTERKDSTLCPWHIKKLCLKRRQTERLTFRTRQSVTGTKSLPRLLRELEHYCPEDHEKRRRGHFWTKQEDDTTMATDELRQRIAEAAANLNDSDEDAELEQTLRGEIVESDSESIDSELEDPLRHAGVFAAEEVSSILRDKMHRLQNLYIEQFRHLKYLLRDKYRKYCMATLMDKDSLLSEFLSEEDAGRLSALRKYHKYRGKEALLKSQAKEKRRALSDSGSQTGHVFVCIFEKDNIKCTNRSLPATHYCSKHILYDDHQVLFRPCASGLQPCLNPVISFQHNNACIIHKDLKTDLSQAKKIVGHDGSRSPAVGTAHAEPELLFQTIDDISSLALDTVVPSALYGLDQFGDLGTSELLQ